MKLEVENEKNKGWYIAILVNFLSLPVFLKTHTLISRRRRSICWPSLRLHQPTGWVWQIRSRHRGGSSQSRETRLWNKGGKREEGRGGVIFRFRRHGSLPNYSRGLVLGLLLPLLASLSSLRLLLLFDSLSIIPLSCSAQRVLGQHSAAEVRGRKWFSEV